MVSYCPICGKPVYFGEKKRSLGRDYHPLCLKCQQCKRQLTAGQHAEHDEKPYCTICYMRSFSPKGRVRNCKSDIFTIENIDRHGKRQTQSQS
ncbi:hypothetical protein ACEWY4_007418 [Coilia grayii]|uniref:Cysteine-rich protein 1 n=1 Tax=Coilia grayii TaxID=363190 RepID=A0ABD1KGR3_9TELE